MASVDVALDTSGFSEGEVVGILDHLWQHHQKHVAAWLEEMAEEQICQDCPGNERRRG
jgi:hypothetical protein